MRKGINIRAGFDLEGFSKSSQNLQRSLRKTARKMDAIGKTFSTYVTAPIIAIGGLSIKAAADIETLKTSLQTALGGTSDAADGAFKSIEAFASKTPYALQEVTSGFIKLKNMGLDPSMDALRSYGNTASAMGKSLNDMVEAVADAAVGEFERLKEFGIKAKSEGDQVSFTFKGVTTTIGKNAAEIEGYLQGIGNTEFAGGIEKQSGTLNGIISTMKDNLSLAAASIGEVVLPEVKKLASFISGLASKFRELSPATKKTIVIVAALTAAIGPLIMAIGAVTAALAFLSANPIVLIITGIIVALAALAAMFYYVKNNLQAFGDFFYNQWVKIANTFIETIQMMAKPYISFMDLLGIPIGVQALAFLDTFKLKSRTATKSFKTIGETVDEVKEKISSLAGDPLAPLATSADKAAVAFTKLQASIGGLSTIKKVKVDTTVVVGKIEGIENLLVEVKEKALHVFEQIGADISASLNSGLQSLASTGAELMGQFLGSLMSGGDMTIRDFGAGILDSIGSFMADFGKAMIAIGVAEAMIKASIDNLNPALAIVGGIALVAAGSALSNVSKKGIDTSGGGSGGYSPPSPSYGGLGNYGTEMVTSTITLSGREMNIVQERQNAFRR